MLDLKDGLYCVTKTKACISYAIMAQLIGVFVFAETISQLSEAAHIRAVS